MRGNPELAAEMPITSRGQTHPAVSPLLGRNTQTPSGGRLSKAGAAGQIENSD
jgi:hypothetical protein